MRYKNFLLLIIILFLAFPISAQQTGTTGAAAGTGSAAVGDDARQLMLALSTADYPATPGDVYNLTYIANMAGGGTAVSVPLTLDAGYQLTIQNMGTVNARNKTYLQVRREVESLVSKSFPLSGPAFTLIRLGRFNVMVSGETAVAGNRSVDGLTRISDLVMDMASVVPVSGGTAAAGNQNSTAVGSNTTPAAAAGSGTTPALSAKASSRRVTVSSAADKETAYDLFQFQRYGTLAQNPYIKPGDRIRILPAGRTIQITGEVFRPGTYELLPGEELESLVTNYADGFTLNADPGRIILSRISTEAAGETRIFDYQGNTGMTLEDRDVITVGNKAITRPAAFFEGALQGTLSGTGKELISGVQETSSDIEGMAKLEYPFYEGETLGNAVRANALRFTASSDLAAAYVIRGGARIPMDLTRYIYYNDFSKDLALENGDIIRIPFLQYFVLVAGAVKAPGRYPYVPDRQADYYINLAGGRDEMKNTGRGETITDMNNRKVKNDVIIEPEMMITVPMNSFIAKFNIYAPVITTVLSLITTTLSILAVTGVLTK
ncbi:hypothetical protein FACS189485_12680 [Spirochaetia bacterium]|nr:hypothetical protein FACS189485_12680 [Spirochaetia bacterium]